MGPTSLLHRVQLSLVNLATDLSVIMCVISYMNGLLVKSDVSMFVIDMFSLSSFNLHTFLC